MVMKAGRGARPDNGRLNWL